MNPNNFCRRENTQNLSLNTGLRNTYLQATTNVRISVLLSMRKSKRERENVKDVRLIRERERNVVICFAFPNLRFCAWKRGTDISKQGNESYRASFT